MMKLLDSLVSVILPVHNSAQTLPSCVESILKQTHKDIEVIIVDDSSKDDSFKIANILRKCDNRIKILKNKKKYGPAVCLNRAMRIAKGSFVTFINPNDKISSYKIKKQISFLKENPKVVAVGTQSVTVDSKGNKQKSSLPLTHDEIYKNLLNGLSVHFETTLINRKLLPKDLIRFTTNVYPLIFKGLFLKISQYGQIANINQHLYWHYEQGAKIYKKYDIKRSVASHISLLFQSITQHEYRPSIKSLLEPLTSPVRTIFR